MARFAASVNLALIVMTMADPTLRPSTPPTQRPTAPSPRPTSSTPQPTDLIRILEQDVQSAPFDLPSNTCAAFQVSFEGGSDRKFRVEITDSERGLNYVAAGLAYYNKNEVFGDPFTLAKCDPVNFDYDAQSPQPHVWKSTIASGAPDNSSLSDFSAMTRPCRLRRAVTNRHRHAIEQASRRWRRRDDSARTRRKILISTQVKPPTHGVSERSARGLRPGARVRNTSYGANRPAGERRLRPRGAYRNACRLCAARRAAFGVDLEQGYAGAAGEPI